MQRVGALPCLGGERRDASLVGDRAPKPSHGRRAREVHCCAESQPPACASDRTRAAAASSETRRRSAEAVAVTRALCGTVANEAASRRSPPRHGKRTDTLHILVNNAGANWGSPFETFPWKAWDRVAQRQRDGLFTLTRDLAPMLTASATRDWPSTVIQHGFRVMGTVTQIGNRMGLFRLEGRSASLDRILAAELAEKSR